MALPTSDSDLKLMGVTRFTATDILRGDFARQLVDARKLPTLQPVLKRAWCAMRGHGGMEPMPGDVYYQNDKLCKRCGARVSLL